MHVFNVGSANFILLSGGSQKKHLIVDAGYDRASNQFPLLCPISNKKILSKKQLI
jgi:hypothetical protein